MDIDITVACVRNMHSSFVRVKLAINAHNTVSSQNVPCSKRPQSKCPPFEAKRPRWSKRPESNRPHIKITT